MRIWKGDIPDYRMVCIGNSRCAAYLNGADIKQIFGPAYSAVSFFTMALQENAQVRSYHLKNRAVWKHNIYIDGVFAGVITDFADSQANVIARIFDLKIKIKFDIKPELYISFKDGIFVSSDKAHVFFDYQTNEKFYLYPFMCAIIDYYNNLKR